MWNAATGAALQGVFVVLRDSGGTRVGASFSDGGGTWVMRSPGPGRWALEASQLGYAPLRSEVVVGAGPTAPVELVLTERPIQLAGISTEGRSRCAGAPVAAAGRA